MSERFTLAQQAAYYMGQTWLVAGYLPVLREKTRTELLTIAHACNAFSLAEPLHLTTREHYEVAGWGVRHKLTGSQVIALLTACIWLLAGDSEDTGASMLLTFPWLKDALILARPEATTEVYNVAQEWRLIDVA